MKKTIILLALLPYLAIAQTETYSMGSVLDDDAYARIPVKAVQLTRSYANLPIRCSLLPYCPTPKSQGAYGTCTSWAVAYAARTIMEAEIMGHTGAENIAQEAFSPSFVYAKIKNYNDIDCQNGSSISDALDLLKRQGVPKLSTFFADCASAIPSSVQSEAATYVIKDYFTLFTANATSSRKVEATKMALAQNRPVIISMECYASFSSAGKCWDGNADLLRGHHAMCVIGYDDEKHGGAFQIMNSWGTTWGDGGFTWVRYSDFGRFVRYGYEMYLDKKRGGMQTALSGDLEIRLASGTTMPLTSTGKEPQYSYRALHSYPSGTRYRIYLSNNQPAYVYAIGADMAGSVDLLFPPSPQVSPALVYSSNSIAIPDEDWYIEMDNTTGTDFLCVLYSLSALPINDILTQLRSRNGSFYQKIREVLGSSCEENPEININHNKISFSSQSKKAIVPIIVEIPHGQ